MTLVLEILFVWIVLAAVVAVAYTRRLFRIIDQHDDDDDTKGTT